MIPATEYRHLTSFVTVAEIGTMSGAADLLDTGTAAVSAHLRKLESSLGTRLFERSGQGLRLTPAGQTFLTHARQIVASTASAGLEVRQLVDDGQSGTLKIGLPPIAARLVAPRLVRHALGALPQVLLRFCEGYSWDVREWLDSGHVDIGLFYSSPGKDLDFSAIVAREELFLIGPRLATMGSGEAVSPDVIFDLPLILPGLPHGHRLQLERLAARQGRQLNVVVEANSLGALIALLRDGFGYGLLPRETLPLAGAGGALAVHRFGGKGLHRTLIMATSARRPVTPLAATFLPVLRGLLA